MSLYGVSFGALSVASGLSVAQTMVLSLVMFSGASQFALIGIIASGGAAAGVAAVLSAGLLGIRNGLYALRMAPVLAARGPLRMLAAQLTIDESTRRSQRPNLHGQRSSGFLDPRVSGCLSGGT